MIQVTHGLLALTKSLFKSKLTEHTLSLVIRLGAAQLSHSEEPSQFS